MHNLIQFFSCCPFILLLLLIATIPLIAPQIWKKNNNKAIIVLYLSLPVILYLMIYHPMKLIGAIEEYMSFILLLASLYIVSGGILITCDLCATPVNNTLFLLIGALLANLVGTTVASMLLIRPLLKSINGRKHIKHIPIFFIIIVSNIGGCLTPLGDPPLFLGYLKGVPFFWTLKLLPIWGTTIGLLLGIFYIWDTICYHREHSNVIFSDLKNHTPFRISGRINFIFLFIVILSILFKVKAPYRELIIVYMIIFSLAFTEKKYRRQNNFTFNPILEVAILFAGIFITIVPLLILLEKKGTALEVMHPWQYFWLTGGLSSFLNNVPTYLTFVTITQSVTKNSLSHLPIVTGITENLLVAISCGAVFMGANTYIGNGPNFMVKTIAEEQGCKMPNFFEYVLYAGVILVPIYIILILLFFI